MHSLCGSIPNRHHIEGWARILTLRYGKQWHPPEKCHWKSPIGRTSSSPVRKRPQAGNAQKGRPVDDRAGAAQVLSLDCIMVIDKKQEFPRVDALTLENCRRRQHPKPSRPALDSFDYAIV